MNWPEATFYSVIAISSGIVIVVFLWLVFTKG